MQEKERFTYVYSAENKSEAEKIRNKYADEKSDESVIEEMRRLDREAYRSGKILGWVLGILGVLMLGAGMSIVMVGKEEHFYLGIILGLVGMITAAAARPSSLKLIKSRKKAIAARILELSDMLLEKKSS